MSAADELIRPLRAQTVAVASDWRRVDRRKRARQRGYAPAQNVAASAFCERGRSRNIKANFFSVRNNSSVRLKNNNRAELSRKSLGVFYCSFLARQSLKLPDVRCEYYFGAAVL